MHRTCVIALIALCGAAPAASAQTAAPQATPPPAVEAAAPSDAAPEIMVAATSAPWPSGMLTGPGTVPAPRAESAPSTAAPADANPPADGAQQFPIEPATGTAAQAEQPDQGEAPVTPVAPGVTAGPAYASVWERIRAGFKMPEITDPLVKKWENFYAARPEYWQRINERGKRYLYFITAEIERRGMPLEIALLPIIESAYNPEALSRARALGIWQFVPATGKIYGLQQNWWLDNRRDVTVATGSALDYLENLYAMFGDWQLALASYNWGEGAVQRAINFNRAKNKPTDYASLKVPTETRNYLPKLQAVKNLIMAPEKFGLGLPLVPDQPYFTTVTTMRQIDVALAARLADMAVEDFKILNPAHNRPVIAGASEQRITLPFDKAESFVTNLDAYALPLVSWRPYQVKSGERLEQVAPRFGIDVDELKRVNGLTGRRKIAPGYTLLVPARSGEGPAGTIPTAMFKEAPSDGPGWHRVKRGESLAMIASRYDTTAADLKRLNGLTGNAVAAGHRLRLHDGVSAASAKPGVRPKAGKKGVKKKPVTPKRRR